MAQNSYRYVFASSTSQLPSTGTTNTLPVGGVGIFDAKTWQATIAPQFPTNSAIVIAQGTPADLFPYGYAKGNQTFKTQEITPQSITKWTAKKAQPAKGEVVTLGFDGVDLTKTLNVDANATNFTFWVTMSGQPIANLLGSTPETHYASYTEQFSIDLPCPANCTENCGAQVDCNVIADAVIASFNTRKLIGGQFMTDYIKVSKLLSCTTPSGVPTVGFTTYSLTLQDTGDNIALAQVQAQYPADAVSRVSYNGITSVYNVVLPTASGTPSPFVDTVNPLIPNCTTCPSGSTLVPTVYLYTVRHQDQGTAANLATIKTNYSDTAAIRLSYDGVTSVYEIHNSTGITPTPFANSGDIVTIAGSLQNVCVSNSTVTTPWTTVSSCTKGIQTYQLTIKNTDCGANYLSQLQAEYGSLGTVALVTTNTGTCTSLYSLTVQSSNVNCDTCDVVPFVYVTPTSFLGLEWEAPTTTVYGTGCNCGIKFESIYEQRQAQECFLKSVPYEFEPLFITLSTRNPDPNDYSVLCSTDVPVTKVSPVQYASGYGRVVADMVIQSNYNFNSQWRRNPAERDAEAYSLGLQLNGYYDQYVIEFTYVPVEAQSISGFGYSQIEKYEWSFFYPQGEGVAFAQAINGYLASANSPLPPVNI